MKQIFLTPAEAWTFARLPDLVQDHQIPTGTVVHIGAHQGEEVAVYRDCGFDRIRLVEPDPEQVEYLTTAYGDWADVEIIAAAVVPAGDGPVRLHRSERSVHSSLLAGTGASVEVNSVVLRDIQDGANVIALDAQGLELELLRTVDLADPDLCLVIVETTRRPDDTAGDFDQVQEYLTDNGYIGVEEWVHDGSGYTDCVYIRAGR